MSSFFSLAGRCAVVTGGSRGIGKATARLFAEAGADVLISSRNADELKEAAEYVGAGLSTRVEWMTADMSDRAQVKHLADEAVRRLGKVDVLFNNAGINNPQPIDEITDDVWDRNVEVDLTSCMAMMRYLVPGMKQRKWGRIVHTSSVLGLGGRLHRNVYCSTKAALIGLTRASSLELGAHGITVNCVCPGPIMTDMPMKLLSDADKQKFVDRTSLGRWGEPREVAAPVLMLASDAGSYITGQTLVIDGGVMAHVL
jgi:NAD(P)-dependent dehydrogenase (short-subunit alcohol dehydrogenase family)